jgi:hypothetical protein
MTSTEPRLFDDEPELLPAIVVEGTGGEVAPLAELAERARNYARSSKDVTTCSRSATSTRDASDELVTRARVRIDHKWASAASDAEGPARWRGLRGSGADGRVSRG